ncbi:MAG: rhodanese-like domain-containing protein, partial [Leptospiraceae bacterium]|nr:rhodanese-like domain-containing protein [Leptospiraceae bacterium]
TCGSQGENTALDRYADQIHNVNAEQVWQIVDHNADNGDFVILDIRTAGEYQSGHLEKAVLMDFYQPDFAAKVERLDRTKTYLVYCNSGNRSGQAVTRLFGPLGFQKVYHLLGGIQGWKRQQLPLVP